MGSPLSRPSRPFLVSISMSSSSALPRPRPRRPLVRCDAPQGLHW
jgi:hypothetical protein